MWERERERGGERMQGKERDMIRRCSLNGANKTVERIWERQSEKQRDRVREREQSDLTDKDNKPHWFLSQSLPMTQHNNLHLKFSQV